MMKADTASTEGETQLVASRTAAAEQNLLLGALPADERERLETRLEWVPLRVGTSIYEADEPIEHVYFPLSGVVSMVSRLREGTVEIGTVGREGMTGIAIVLESDSMPTRAFTQVGGEALRIPSAELRGAMQESPALWRVLARYSLSLFDQAAQGSACNRLHALEARCARWLLMTHDRVGDDVLPLKQTFLAEMLGVHRPAVSVAAGALQRAGMIRYSRGKVRVLDRAALERASCECYAITRRGFDRRRDD